MCDQNHKSEIHATYIHYTVTDSTKTLWCEQQHALQSCERNRQEKVMWRLRSDIKEPVYGFDDWYFTFLKLITYKYLNKS
jgi:hypothetical protein